eukprot:gene11611-biopygen3590
MAQGKKRPCGAPCGDVLPCCRVARRVERRAAPCGRMGRGGSAVRRRAALCVVSSAVLRRAALCAVCAAPCGAALCAVWAAPCGAVRRCVHRVCRVATRRAVWQGRAVWHAVWHAVRTFSFPGTLQDRPF